MRTGHCQVDGCRRRQALRGAHERISLVRVVGAFGLTQQCGDARQHFVVGHSANLRDGYDTSLIGETHRRAVIHETTSSSTWSRSGSLKTS